MSTKINKVKKYIKSMQHKVVEVTKDHYTLDNGDVYEHQFEIDENITVDEFQKLLDEVPQNKCCVLFITHKEKLSESEQRSLEQMIKVFEGKRDIFLLVPNTISLDFYSQYADHVNIRYIEHKHTESYLAYNAMLCSDWFYEKFKMYEYMLIYQSDCWVFEDKLDMFMDLGYDYYGAPWPHYKDKVGNGGFSLRKISAMLNVASKYEYDPKEKKNEDTWFCLTHGDELNICPTNIGCNFAIERMSNKYKQLIKTRPMGLHGNEMMKYWNTDGYGIKKGNYIPVDTKSV